MAKVTALLRPRDDPLGSWSTSRGLNLLAAAVDDLLETAGQAQIAILVEARPSRRCGTSRW